MKAQVIGGMTGGMEGGQRRIAEPDHRLVY
jgi:hypothetical protein